MEENSLTFEQIRPYTDADVPRVLQGITDLPSFSMLMGYLYPDVPVEQVAEQLQQIKTVAEFQHVYIRQAVQNIVRDSISELTQEGLDQLDPDQAYLFLSNHRDIILDSALLNFLRHELGYDTTQIAIGDNLLISPMVSDLMKLNKSFVVHRQPPRNQAFAYSLRLSNYIRSLIEERTSSIWLAQRNGRTKDGKDQTQTALLKMLHLSGPDELVESFRRLQIVPLSISYEFEPCDYLKAEELLYREKGETYQKDDKMAIIRGIREPKGRVHVAAGKPLDQELDSFAGIRNRNDFLRALGGLIDEQIHQLYRRWPIQYAAFDLQHGDRKMEQHYSAADCHNLKAHIEQRLTESQAEPEALRKMLYRIYAGMIAPVDKPLIDKQ